MIIVCGCHSIREPKGGFHYVLRWHRHEVLELKELLATYGLYGITAPEDAAAFKAQYDEAEENVKPLKAKVKLFNSSIRELYKVKSLYGQMITTDFAYGVLFDGDPVLLTDGIKEIQKDGYKLDYLKALEKRLNGLDISDFENDGLPDPQEYRILRDLEDVYPGILEGIKMDDPRDVEDAIAALQMSGWLQNEIEREEKAEKSSEKEPNARELIDSVKKQSR